MADKAVDGETCIDRSIPPGKLDGILPQIDGPSPVGGPSTLGWQHTGVFEHAPEALQIAGITAVVAESYARIFYRNAVDGGFFIPCESTQRLIADIKTGDDLEINISAGTLKNVTSGKSYGLRPLGDVLDIVTAGGIFAYARKTGMLKP